MIPRDLQQIGRMGQDEESVRKYPRREVDLEDEAITRSIIGAFYKVYSAIGCGLPEKLCIGALQLELEELGFEVALEVRIDVVYRGRKLGSYRIDMLVADRVLVEVKSVEELHPKHVRQTRNYLRLSELRTGLLLHFGNEPKFYRFFSDADKRRGASVLRSPIGQIRLI